MATREELIEYRVSNKGETIDVATKKVDAYLSGKALPAPKATPNAKTPPKPAAGSKPEPPKPSPATDRNAFPSGQVPYVGGGYYAPAAAPRPAPIPVMTDREIAEIAAEQGIRTWTPTPAAARPAPPDKIPSVVRNYSTPGPRFSDMGYGLPPIDVVRATIKASLPAAAAAEIDAMGAEDLADAYGRIATR